MSPGLTYPNGYCDESYFCTQSAIDSKPSDSSTGGVCTLGHYCLRGTCAPLPCKVTII